MTDAPISTSAQVTADELPMHLQIRQMGRKIQREAREAALATEKQLKGFYTDWIFDKLNLVKYR